MKTVQLRLPATSANLGPGFDAMALALELFLEIDAVPAAQFSIHSHRAQPEYLRRIDQKSPDRDLQIGPRRRAKADCAARAYACVNGIPVGMGCGSSAAVRLAAVALASAFGDLDWDAAKIVDHAVRLEGHPDNVAACWYGGLTIAANSQQLAIDLPPAAPPLASPSHPS